MKEKINLIKSVIPNFNSGQLKDSFSTIGIDSIDLVTIRVEFERALGFTIPDKDWINFQSFHDIIQYCNKPGKPTALEEINPPKSNEILRINMPQMAIQSLSENWLFKEIGSRHWTLLCDGLGVDSDKIKDQMGNRLYATFVRIRIEINSSLSQFVENEEIALNSHIHRFGNGLYFSKIGFHSEHNNIITANLMTSFTRRSGAGNKDLVKSQPFSESNSIEDLRELPKFGNEYRLLKRKESNIVNLGKHEISRKEETLFEIEYNLNPYYDLNGVGLLYFASYPIINDYCEALYANKNLIKDTKVKWEETYSTQSRDVLYFANCDIHETIVYRLHSIEVSENNVRTHSSLHRKSDNKIMAEIFTIKVKKS